MLESFKGKSFEYKKLPKEEMEQRGILGRLVGPIADTKNATRNGRKYGVDLWEKALNNPILKEKIENKCVLSELGHPADRTEVDIEKACACLAETPKLGDDGLIYGVFDILDTKCGKVLKTLCDYGTKIGISSRGQGDVISGFNGEEEVDPNTYDLETWDFVLLPAVKSARMSYVTEALNKKKYNRTLKESLNKLISEANEDEKKVMLESLDNIGVDIKNEELADYSKIDKKDAAYFDEEISKVVNNLLTIAQEADYAGLGTISDTLQNAMDVIGVKGNELVENKPVKEGLMNAIAMASDSDKIDIKKISAACGLTDDQEKALINFLGVECNSENCADKEVQSEAVVNNEADIVNELQEALQSKKELESKLTELQEKLSVSYAKEANLEEEVNKQRRSIEKLSLDSKRANALQEKVSKLTSINEELNKKFSENASNVKKLEERLRISTSAKNNLKEDLGSSNTKVTKLNEAYNSLKEEYAKEKESLNESIAELKKDLQLKSSEYSRKIESSNKLVEKYKRIATNSVDKYIASQALKLGVTSNEIKNRLPESYTFEDIDAICEDLQDYKLNISKLPFNLNEDIRIKTTKKKESLLPTFEEEDVDDSLKRLAGIK